MDGALARLTAAAGDEEARDHVRQAKGNAEERAEEEYVWAKNRGQ
jgi:division protein CdvB (Snf7/Vps24/ESCRT-III family)